MLIAIGVRGPSAQLPYPSPHTMASTIGTKIAWEAIQLRVNQRRKRSTATADEMNWILMSRSMIRDCAVAVT